MKPERATSRVWVIARRLALFLTLGAMVNVGVATTSAYLPRSWMKHDGNLEEWYFTAHDRWPITVPTDWPDASSKDGERTIAFRHVIVNGGPIPMHDSYTGPKSVYPYFTHSVQLLESGWPMYTMRAYRTCDDRPSQRWSEWRGALPISGHSRLWPGECSIPVGPIPLGFTLNTLFYAALLYVPFFGFTAFKRRRRTRRGLCPACAYDLAGLTACPECGRKVG